MKPEIRKVLEQNTIPNMNNLIEAKVNGVTYIFSRK